MPTRVNGHKCMEEAFLEEWQQGSYTCKACSSELYHSRDKFRATNSQRPSFRKSVEPISVFVLPSDNGYGVGESLICGKCEQPIGFLYRDASVSGDPTPTSNNERHSIMSKALVFTPSNPNQSPDVPPNRDSPPPRTQTIPGLTVGSLQVLKDEPGLQTHATGTPADAATESRPLWVSVLGTLMVVTTGFLAYRWYKNQES